MRPDLEETVTAALKEFNLSEDAIRTLSGRKVTWGETVFSVHTRSEQYVLKLARRPQTKPKRLWKWLFGSARLKNEAEVYKALQANLPSTFGYPKLIKTDNKNYILIQRVHTINKTRSLEESPAYRQRAIDALLAFQTSNLALRRKLFYLLHSPFWRFLLITLRLAKSLSGIRLAARSLKVFLKCHAKQPRLEPPVILHNDLGRGNILIDNEGRYFIIDFEDVIQESRWLFFDIVHMAWREKNPLYFLDLDLLGLYWESLKRYPHLRRQVNMKAQIRVTLMIHGLLRYFNRPKRHAEFHRFFKSVLLIDDDFDAWYACVVEQLTS